MPIDVITAAARTVTQVADHFDRLKADARVLLETFGASKRGYFTPSEEEEVRHLQVSYWQSRAAMLELVDSLRDRAEDAHTSEHLRREAFVVGYAAAVVLVDAAKFLQETFGEREVVLAKLNQPAPEFGIPERSYHRVQRSLTNPINAWHLYNAEHYLDENEASLVEMSKHDAHLAPVMELLLRLRDRARVSPTDVAAARVKVRARQVVDHLRMFAVDDIMYGLQEMVSRMLSEIHTPGRMPTGESPNIIAAQAESDHVARPSAPTFGVPERVREQARAMMRPGDVIVTRTEHAVTNYFLPGYWPHAALYLGDASSLEAIGLREHEHMKPRWARLLELDATEPARVIEALKDGVWLRSLRSPMKGDAFVIIRPTLDAREVASAVARSLVHEGKPYDFDFDFARSDRLVCTEVVYRAYDGIGGVQFTLTRRAGRLNLAAEDLLQLALDRRWFEPLAVYCPLHRASAATPSLHVGADAESLLRATLSRT